MSARHTLTLALAAWLVAVGAEAQQNAHLRQAEEAYLNVEFEQVRDHALEALRSGSLGPEQLVRTEDLFNVMLQVMDSATLTDNVGRKSDFRNVVLIMTTNAGAREMNTRAIGFGQGASQADATRATKAIERTFSPEFRNRLDAWVLFSGLDREVILKVVDKEVRLLTEQLAERNVVVEITDAAREWLADHGYDPAFGARPMGRTVETHMKKALAEAILFGELKDGGTVLFDVSEDDPEALAWEKLDAEA